MEFDPFNWYWFVTDHSPGTQVWSSDRGQFVVLADAAYQAFLTAGGTTTTISTFAGLMAYINTIAALNPAETIYVNLTSAGDITLTNPLARVLLIGMTGISHVVTFPKMNLCSSIPIGTRILLINTGGNDFSFTTFNSPPAQALFAGAAVELILEDNLSQDGNFYVDYLQPRLNFTGVGNNWVQRFDRGVPILIQPDFTDISGVASATQGGTAQSTWTTGDLLYASNTNTLAKLAGVTPTTKKYLQSVGTGVGTNAPSWQQVAYADLTGSIPNATVLAGDLNATPIAAPSPSLGQVFVYVDSTSNNWCARQSSGTTNHGVQTKASAAHNFLTAVQDDGTVTAAQPAAADISDYAEGTFTPTLTFGGGSTGITFSTQTGKYRRIGNLVFISINLVLTSKGSSTGIASINALPFTAADQCAVAVSAAQFGASTATTVTAVIGNGSTVITPSKFSAGARATLLDTDFSGGDTLRLTGCYPI